MPEERRIFTDLTVGENLEVGTRAPPYGARPWTFERVVALFPNLAALRDRPAGEISGGEQQMLATARTLMGNPRLLLLDEPSEGLAPAIVQQMVHAIRELRREGVSVLLSEQNIALARAVADRTYVLESSHLRYVGPLATFADSTARHEYLGLD